MTDPQAVTQKHLKMQSFTVKNSRTVFFSSNSGELPIPQDIQKKNMEREKIIIKKKKLRGGRRRKGVGGGRDRGREMHHRSIRKAIMSRLQLIFYLCANWK